jgi:transcriptional regulator with XRE-family HTH domain
VISGAQIRAARALLGVSAAEMAKRADISHRTLQRFEAADGLPDAQIRLLERVKVALEAMGVKFSGDPVSSPGVQLQRLHPKEPHDV